MSPKFRLAVCTAVSFRLSLWPQGLLYYSSLLLNSRGVTVNNALFTLDCQFAVTTMPSFSFTLSPQLFLYYRSFLFWKQRPVERAALHKKWNFVPLRKQKNQCFTLYNNRILPLPVLACCKLLQIT
jgi:hypothetical protein